MSAWIVSKRHIDFIVTAGIAAEIVQPSKADETGRLLWAENLRSVAYRYPYDSDGTRPGPVGFRDRDVERYQWRETPVLKDGALAKTIGCYDYQTCEHPEYESSEAFRLVTELSRISDRDNAKYPDDVPWGWPDWDEVEAVR